jgi:hypothetical protein
MRTLRRRQVRPAYTLLEVMLAGSISVLLLGALYVAVDTQVRQTQAARDRIEQATLARNLFARISSDLTPSLGATDPSRFRVSGNSGQGGGNGQSGQTGQSGQPGQSGAAGTGMGSGAGGAGAAGAGAGNMGTGNAGTGNSGSGNSGSGNSGSGSSTTTGVQTNSSFILTVQGTSTTLALFITRVPRDILQMLTSGQMPAVPSGDQRRIAYWLASSGTGLARQELPLVTSDDAGTAPGTGENDDQYVLAPEVQSLTFSYFDGTNWNDTWDGTTAGGNDNVPIGPPVAIAVVVGLAPPGTPPGTTVDPDKVKTYRHVIFLPTSNGPTTTQPQTTTSGSQP